MATRSTSIVSVIAGGWSFSQVDHNLVPGHIIAINDSAFYLKRRPNEIVSMDRMWAELRWEWLKEQMIATHLRRTCVQNLFPVGIPAPSWLNVYDCDHESVEFEFLSRPAHMTQQPPRLNGTNSATVGLNLAWLRRPDNLYLFGFDMMPGPNGERHWHPPYPAGMQGDGKKFVNTPGSKFKRWAQEFDLIAEQFDRIGTRVFNVSNRTQIGTFPILSIKNLKQVAA